MLSLLSVPPPLLGQALLEWVEPLVSRATRVWHTALCGLSASCCATFILHILIEEMGGRSIGIGKVRRSHSLGSRRRPDESPARAPPQLTAAKAEIAAVSCFMLYLASYLHSFRHARISMTITFACEGGATPSEVGGGGLSVDAEKASLSSGFSEAAEEWILKQLS